MVSGSTRFRANFQLLSREPDILALLFRSPKARHAARLFLDWLRQNGSKASVEEFRRFVKSLEAGKVEKGFSYSQTRFYKVVIGALRGGGLLGRVKSRGQILYVPLEHMTPDRNPSPGTFYGLAWLVAQKWNQEWEEARIVLKTQQY